MRTIAGRRTHALPLLDKIQQTTAIVLAADVTNGLALELGKGGLAVVLDNLALPDVWADGVGVDEGEVGDGDFLGDGKLGHYGEVFLGEEGEDLGRGHAVENGEAAPFLAEGGELVGDFGYDVAAVAENVVEGEAATGHAVGNATDEVLLADLDCVLVELAADAGRIEDFLAREEDLVHVAGLRKGNRVFGRGTTDIDRERRAEFDVGHFGD